DVQVVHDYGLYNKHSLSFPTLLSSYLTSLVTEVARVRVTAVARRRGAAGSSSGRGAAGSSSGRGAGARVPAPGCWGPGAGVRPADRSAGAVAVVFRVAV